MKDCVTPALAVGELGDGGVDFLVDPDWLHVSFVGLICILFLRRGAPPSKR